jgi:thiol-disulfide isomerase/thioredoxin
MTAKKLLSKVAWYGLSALIGILVMVLGVFIGKRAYGLLKKSSSPAPLVPAFDARDTVTYTPVPNKVFDTTSDMTVNAVLSGGLGEAVVLIYADWCVHCRTMMPAFESAAIKSSVPFIRIQGQSASVTSTKHKVLGYPTVLGITSTGVVKQFKEQRTEEELLKFAEELKADPVPEVIQVAPSVVPPS